MAEIKQIYGQLKAWLNPSWLVQKVAQKVAQWKNMLVRTLWKGLAYMPRSADAIVEKTFRLRDKKNKITDVQLLRPFFNCELPTSSFKLFLQDLDKCTPDEWLKVAFTVHRDRLMRFRPTREQTAQFLEQARKALVDCPDIKLRQEKLRALHLIEQFNARSPELCVPGEETSVYAFELALRLFDAGLHSGQVRMPVYKDVGFSRIGTCGPTAMMMAFNHTQPYLYTGFVLDLLEKGEGTTGKFSLKVPTVLKAVPEHMQLFNPLDRILLGSFVSTPASFLPFHSVTSAQMQNWIKKIGWENAEFARIIHDGPLAEQSQKEAIQALEAASDSEPVILSTASTIASGGLPYDVCSNPEVMENYDVEDDGLHCVPVFSCKVLDDKRIEMKIGNYGRINTVRVSTDDLLRLTKGYIRLNRFSGSSRPPYLPTA